MIESLLNSIKAHLFNSIQHEKILFIRFNSDWYPLAAYITAFNSVAEMLGGLQGEQNMVNSAN